MGSSVWFPIAGLVVALLRFVWGVKSWLANRLLSNDQLSLQYKVALAAHHEKYIDLLNKTIKEAQPAIDELSRVSHQELNVLLAFFDKHSKNPLSSRHTRHVCYRLCELVFSSFRGQLTRQRGLYLNDQYRRLRCAEVDFQVDSSVIKELERDATRENCDFTSLYISNPNQYAFDRLEGSATFILTLNDLTSRFSPDAGQDLFSDGITCVQRYKDVHEKWSDCIVRQVATLKEGIERNKYEEFPLNHSPRLFHPYWEQIRRLEILETFSLPDWGYAPFPYKVDLPVSQMLYAACILYTVSSYHSWGVDYDK